MAEHPAPATPAARRWRYGAIGAPLAFVALPLYVQWPAHAAAHWGLPLAALGALLLAVRLGDALIDPWIGRRIDRWFAISPRRVWQIMGGAGLAIAVGMAALADGPAALQASPSARWAWLAAALVLTSIGTSVAVVAHQSWVTRLATDVAEQARWIGTRELCALAGVLAASVAPGLLGWPATAALLAAMLPLGWWAMRGFAMPAASVRPAITASAPPTSPWRRPAFRALMAVYLLNGLASALPATLVLWFMRDRLQLAPGLEGPMLMLYFAAAALGLPAWVRAVRRFGLVSTWLLGMIVAVLGFASAGALQAGQASAFAVVCVVTGLALGADLVVPPALLARVIGAADTTKPRDSGEAFGWWNLATKLNLALAAGLALPLVQALGYAPGQRDPTALSALALTYAALPCAIKLLAAALLWALRRSMEPRSDLHPVEAPA